MGDFFKGPGVVMIGLAIGLVLLMAGRSKGGGGAPTGGTKLAATMSSIQTASQANIALASIAAQKDVAISQQRVAERLGRLDWDVKKNLIAKEYLYRMAELDMRRELLS